MLSMPLSASQQRVVDLAFTHWEESGFLAGADPSDRRIAQGTLREPEGHS